MTRIALDTNVLAYAAGVDRAPGDGAKIALARDLLRRLGASATLVVPSQALGELFVVLRRAGASRAEARTIVLEFRETLAGADSGGSVVAAALDLSVDHQLQYWDALILSSAVGAGCALLVSEDMHDGFVHGGLTVVNPFAEKPHRKLALLLEATRPA